MNHVRKDLGIEPVPVPTGRSTAGPGHAAPDQPARPGPRHPSDPMTEVLGRQIDRHGRTGVLPGMGAGPTMNVNGRRPAVERARPGVPPHIRRRRARFAVAIILLLAVTIGAIGWWLGSGRWTQVPDLLGQEQAAAIDLLQEAGLDPDCCDEQWSEEFPAGAVISTDPKAGEAIRGTDVRLVVSKGPERFRVDPALVGKAVGRRRAAAAGEPARDPVHDRRAVRQRRPGRARSSASTRPPAPTSSATRSSRSSSASGHEPVAVPDVTGQTPEQASRNLEALGFSRPAGRGRAQRRRRRRRGHGVSPGPGDGPVAFGSTVTITRVGRPAAGDGARRDRHEPGRGRPPPCRPPGSRSTPRSSSATRCAQQQPPPARSSSRARTVKILVAP